MKHWNGGKGSPESVYGPDVVEPLFGCFNHARFLRTLFVIEVGMAKAPTVSDKADPDRHLAELLARESAAAAGTEDQAEGMLAVSAVGGSPGCNA